MVKHSRTKKYEITDGVSPLSSEFFLSDSSVPFPPSVAAPVDKIAAVIGMFTLYG